MNPKAFISHASEDKDNFVLGFATKLREKGIDAWLDKWEMLPGDSLIDKIFEEGIKEAEAFIIVLSKNSINKPWVREEINASFVKKIGSKCKIIPVVIDECEVPECLKSTIWETINNVNNYDDSLNRIIKSIYEIREKPKLGEAPKYTKTIIDISPELNKTDNIIFNLSCEAYLSSGHNSVNLSDIYNQIRDYDIEDNDIAESLEILASKSFIKPTRVLGGAIPFFFITHYGFDTFIRQKYHDYDLIVKDIGFKVINEGMKTAHELSHALNIPIALVDHIIESLENNNLVKSAKSIGGIRQIYHISAELKRRLT